MAPPGAPTDPQEPADDTDTSAGIEDPGAALADEVFDVMERLVRAQRQFARSTADTATQQAFAERLLEVAQLVDPDEPAEGEDDRAEPRSRNPLRRLRRRRAEPADVEDSAEPADGDTQDEDDQEPDDQEPDDQEPDDQEPDDQEPDDEQPAEDVADVENDEPAEPEPAPRRRRAPARSTRRRRT